MKKIIAAAVVMLAIGSAGSLTAQEIKGPKIAAKEMRYDSGNVVQGTQVNHVFEISNNGNEVLIIERVQSS
jgi:hypothetical protein